MGWSALGNEPLSEEARWEPPPSERGSFSILSNCVITLVLCVWTAMHLNIPPLKNPKHTRGKGDVDEERSGFSIEWEKIKYVLLGLIMPEVVTAIALTQWLEQRALLKYISRQTLFGTHTSRKKEDEEQASGIQMSSIKRPGQLNVNSETSPEQPSPDKTAREATRIPVWTTTHCWYALMGGFVIESQGQDFDFPLPNRLRRMALTTNGVRYLAKHHPHIFPPIRRSQILDKSKSDSMAKALTCLQAVRFCVDILGRLAQGLPLTVLELNTAAHCVCTLLCFIFWWNKPLNIVEPSLISLKSPEVQKLLARMCIESREGIYAKQESCGDVRFGFFKRSFSSLRNWFRTGNMEEQANLGEKGISILSSSHDSVRLYVLAEDVGRYSGSIMVNDIRRLRSPHLLTWGVMATNPVARIRDLERLKMLHRLADVEDGMWLSSNWRDGTTYSSGDWLRSRASNFTLDGETEKLVGPSDYAFSAACVTYAGLHAAAWNGPFGSQSELYLWRMGILSFAPLLYALGLLTSVVHNETAISYFNTLRRRIEYDLERLTGYRDALSLLRKFVCLNLWTFVWAFILLLKLNGRSMGASLAKWAIFVYICLAVVAFLTGRLFLVVEAFLALPHAPDGAFTQLVWSSYFPHFA